MKKKELYSFWLILLFFAASMSNAQEYSMLSDSQKLELRLQSHVLVDLDAIPMVDLRYILDEKIPIAVNLSKSNHINLTFVQKYLNYGTPLIVVERNGLDSLLVTEITTIRIKAKDVETIDLATVQVTDSTLIRFNGLQELGYINYENKGAITDSLIFNIWKHSGKLPNFIQAKRGNLDSVIRVVSMFNANRKLFGVVKSEKGLLSQVTFKNAKNAKANGYFSFPIPQDGKKPILTPHKAGYYFSPDIILVSPDNQNNMKEFMGFPLNAEFGLSDYFVFEKTIQNTIRKNDNEIIINNVLFEDDDSRGSVGVFKDRAYIDAGIGSRTALKSSFTITAWVKPTVQDKNNSIMGKGEGFVLKIHDGFLTFTIAGIKDYVSKASPIPLNEWSHIALVHSKIDNDLRFFLNGVQTDRVDLIADYITSDYNLLIGSNLWEEFFVGYLDDIKIWERELNVQEIKHQYDKISKEESEFNKLFVWGAAVFAVSLILFLTSRFFRKRSDQKRSIRKVDFSNLTLSDIDKTILDNYKGQVFCFGTLRILNEERVDIAKKLSPMLKKLFIIVFLHSYGDKKGISTKKLTELLWPGVTVQGAKNTRGTNIQNLKTILNATSEINLVFKDKLWLLELSNKCYCDYHTALHYLDYFANEKYSLPSLKNELPKLLDILKGGRFLTSTNDSWLDPYVEKFSNQVIEECLRYAEKLDIKTHSDLLFNNAEVMYIYDDLNERALQIKLQVLIQQGKLSLAHTVHDNFAKLYQKLYKETYAISFEDMISEHQTSL